MYRLMIDTNVLIDAVDPRRPDAAAARRILSWCNGSGDRGIACSASLKDVYYVMEKIYSEKYAREAVRELTELLSIGNLGPEECVDALLSSEPDYEDGLIRSCAELNDADFIITRDAAAFGGSRIKSMTPRTFIDAVISADARRHGGY